MVLTLVWLTSRLSRVWLTPRLARGSIVKVAVTVKDHQMDLMMKMCFPQDHPKMLNHLITRCLKSAKVMSLLCIWKHSLYTRTREKINLKSCKISLWKGFNKVWRKNMKEQPTRLALQPQVIKIWDNHLCRRARGVSFPIWLTVLVYIWGSSNSVHLVSL